MRRLDRGTDSKECQNRASPILIGAAPAARLSRPCTGRPWVTVRAALRPLCLRWLDGERGERGESPALRSQSLRLVRGSTVPGTEKPRNGAPGGERALPARPHPKVRSDRAPPGAPSPHSDEGSLPIPRARTRRENAGRCLKSCSVIPGAMQRAVKLRGALQTRDPGLSACVFMDPGSRAELVIGPRFARTRWRSAGMTRKMPATSAGMTKRVSLFEN